MLKVVLLLEEPDSPEVPDSLEVLDFLALLAHLHKPRQALV
jgi:hypothetical protein